MSRTSVNNYKKFARQQKRKRNSPHELFYQCSDLRPTPEPVQDALFKTALASYVSVKITQNMLAVSNSMINTILEGLSDG